jgi:hypothetical protein
MVPPTAKVKRLLPGRGAKATPISMDLRGFRPQHSVQRRQQLDHQADRSTHGARAVAGQGAARPQ